MNIVLYTLKDLEPITVIALPWLTEPDLQAFAERVGGRFWLLPVQDFMPFPDGEKTQVKLPAHDYMQIEIELFIYRGQRRYFFTISDEYLALALGMESSLLPGQRRQMLREKERGFAEGFATAFLKMLNG